MMWAVAVMCFFGFFRLGELTAKSESTTDDGLLFSDVSVDSQESPKTVAIRPTGRERGAYLPRQYW